MPLNSLPPGQPPGIYPGPALASLLRANESVWLFQNQFFPASGGGGTSVNTQANRSNPYASIAVQLERIKSAFYPFGFSLHCFFTNSSGAALNPGTIELDLQTFGHRHGCELCDALRVYANDSKRVLCWPD